MISKCNNKEDCLKEYKFWAVNSPRIFIVMSTEHQETATELKAPHPGAPCISRWASHQQEDWGLLLQLIQAALQFQLVLDEDICTQLVRCQGHASRYVALFLCGRKGYKISRLNTAVALRQKLTRLLRWNLRGSWALNKRNESMNLWTYESQRYPYLNGFEFSKINLTW